MTSTSRLLDHIIPYSLQPSDVNMCVRVTFLGFTNIYTTRPLGGFADNLGLCGVSAKIMPRGQKHTFLTWHKGWWALVAFCVLLTWAPLCKVLWAPSGNMVQLYGSPPSSPVVRLFEVYCSFLAPKFINFLRIVYCFFKGFSIADFPFWTFSHAYVIHLHLYGKVRCC